jgi:hypothetical protein
VAVDEGGQVQIELVEGLIPSSYRDGLTPHRDSPTHHPEAGTAEWLRRAREPRNADIVACLVTLLRTNRRWARRPNEDWPRRATSSSANCPRPIPRIANDRITNTAPFRDGYPMTYRQGAIAAVFQGRSSQLGGSR